MLSNPVVAEEKPNAPDSRQDAVLRLAIAEAYYRRALYLLEAASHKTSLGRKIYNNLALDLCDLPMEVKNLPVGKAADQHDSDELKLGVTVLKFLNRSAHQE